MRGRRPKPTALHLLHGTFRKDRHGQRIDAPRPKRDPHEFDPWDLLKLENAPPPLSRRLDPIEEILQREGIEIRPEDRKPKAP